MYVYVRIRVLRIGTSVQVATRKAVAVTASQQNRDIQLRNFVELFILAVVANRSDIS